LTLSNGCFRVPSVMIADKLRSNLLHASIPVKKPKPSAAPLYSAWEINHKPSSSKPVTRSQCRLCPQDLERIRLSENDLSEYCELADCDMQDQGHYPIVRRPYVATDMRNRCYFYRKELLDPLLGWKLLNQSALKSRGWTHSSRGSTRHCAINCGSCIFLNVSVDLLKC
jgi:hypothetical protein